MKYLVLLCALFLIGASPVEVSEVQESGRIEQDILNGKLAARTEKALDNLIMTAAGELKDRGYILEGSVMENEWFNNMKYTFRAYASQMGGRPIGDHKPLSQWLADKYNMLEMILGVEVCKRMHFSDLKTFNYCIPIVFRPCTFDMGPIVLPRIEEYRNHFAKDHTYFGLVPVVTYWVTYGVCGAATMGSGFILVCGTAGNIAEKIVGNWVAPRLSDKIFTRFCGGK